jgi:Tetratricopeptide repeat
VQMNATGLDSQAPTPAASPLLATAEWPVRCGAVPPLADRFSTRPETAPDLMVALDRSTTVMLTPRPRRPGAGSPQDWLRCSGKTQLAAFFAESQWRARSVDLLVWIDASSMAAILSGYVQAARMITGTQLPGDAESVAASFVAWLRHTGKRWLLVLDDLADTSALPGLWPGGPAGRVVITAANPQTLVGLRDVLSLEIGPFSPREAMSYLVGRLSSDPDQRRGAIDLIGELNCQPLALTQATAALGSSWMTCDEYRERFARRSSVLTPPGTEPPPAAAITWTLSVDHADQLMPGGGAQFCLATAAMLDGHGIPAPVFATTAASGYIAGGRATAAQAEERSRVALVSLEQSGLISIDRASDPPMVRMGEILQRAVRAAMPADMLEQASKVAAGALLEFWPDDDRGTWLGQSLRSCAASLQRGAGRLLWAEGCHPVLLRAGRSMDEASLTGSAIEYWTELTAIGDQVFGPGHPDSMLIVERLARAFVAAGRAPEAVAWHERVTADCARAFGPDHPRTLAARVSLGRVLVSAGLFDEAISVLAAALSDCERAYGPGHPESASIRDEVAAGYRAAGHLGEAIRLYRLILGERERGQGAQHPDTMATRQRLAETYLADGRLKEAFSQYKRLVADRQRSQGADHQDTLRARAALASAYHLAGRMAMAVQLSEQVYAGTQRVLGADHPDTLASAVALARAYYSVGRLTDSITLFRDVVARGERVLAPGDPLTRSARESLAAMTGE